MKILGISAYNHNSAACILEDGLILAAAEEEKFSRISNDAKFPFKSIDFCLRSTNTKLSELTAIAYYEKPFLKFERLLESYFSSAPFSLSSFLKQMPIWLGKKLNFRNTVYKNLRRIEEFEKSDLPILFPSHQVSHAASGFYSSPFDEAAVLTLDGVGEWNCGIMGIARNHEIEILSEMEFPHSIGLLYKAFSEFLGFNGNDGEQKVMRLASFGDLNSREYQN